MIFNGRASFTNDELYSQLGRIANGTEFDAYRSYLLNKREMIIEKLTLDKSVIISNELRTMYVGRLGVVDELLSDIFSKYSGQSIKPELMLGSSTDKISSDEKDKTSKPRRGRKSSRVDNDDAVVNK